MTAIAVCETNQATVFNDQIGMVEIHTNKKVHLPKFLLGTTHLYYVTDTGNIIFKTNYRQINSDVFVRSVPNEVYINVAANALTSGQLRFYV